jgi:hypothetical protein
MKLATSLWLLWLSLGAVLALGGPNPNAEESYLDWGLQHILGSFESVNTYFNSFLELSHTRPRFSFQSSASQTPQHHCFEMP